MPRHLFFDLDGTLTDPAVGIVACFQHAIRALSGPVLPDADLNRFIGPPLVDSFREILATEDSDVIGSAVRHYRERFSSRGLFENEVYAGIPDALADLRESGFEMWVVTSKPQVYADRILAHFGLRDRFTAVYGAELSGERSGKKELLAYVLEQERICPSDACMIGDRRHDMEGAKAHPGLVALGVLWGYGTRGELDAAGADDLVERVEQLPATVRRMMGGHGN